MSRRGDGSIPHVIQRGWRALLYLPQPWLDRVRWILRRLDERKGLYAAQLARETNTRKATACALLRSPWVPWAREALRLPSVAAPSENDSGTAPDGPDPRLRRALDAIEREPIGNRSQDATSPTRKARR